MEVILAEMSARVSRREEKVRLQSTTITKSFFAHRKDWSRVGVTISKGLVRNGKKDWKKDWERIGCLCSTHEEDTEEALSKDLGMHDDVSCVV